MICGKHSRMRSPSPPNDALYLSTTFAGAAFWTTVNGACAADEIRPSSMTTTSEKRSYASWQLVDSCWHSRLQEGKRKVLLASIENSENWRDGMPARVGYPGHLEGQKPVQRRQPFLGFVRSREHASWDGAKPRRCSVAKIRASFLAGRSFRSPTGLVLGKGRPARTVTA